MADWIPISHPPELTEHDSFKRPMRRVFFYVPGRGVLDGYAAESFGQQLIFWPPGHNGFRANEVTHWMPNPLPRAPKLDGKEGE